MSFFDAAWLWALLPVLPFITFLYFLKLKRREMVVASTFLWGQAIKDLRVNSPFQKLRMNLLLFLQLLIAALIIFTLARPRASVGNLGGRDLVILIDRSASMGAKLDGSTRFQRAQREASRLIEDMANNDRALVIAFDMSPRIIEPFNNSKRTLTQALSGLKCSDKGTRLNDALELAFKVAQGDSEGRPREVHLFSDGVAEELGRVLTQAERERGKLPETAGELRARLPKGVQLHYVQTGQDQDNYGITGIDLRRTMDREALLQLFVGLVNESSTERELGVDIKLDGELIESRSVSLSQGAVTSLVIDSDRLKAGQIEVSLEVEDGLDIDNRAFAVARPRQELSTLLVSPGNRFMENALETMRFVRYKVLDAAAYEDDDPVLAEYDVIIFDRCRPKLMPPAGCLFINALPPYKRLNWGKELKFPRIVDWNETHPVCAYVNFDNLEPLKMRGLRLSEGDEALVDSEGGPLVSVIREGGRDSLLLSFDILESRWPFQAGFPIFLANTLRWLGGESARSRQLATGEHAVISVGEGAGQVKVTAPGGEEHWLEIDANRRIVTFTQTHKQGFYKAEIVRSGKVEKQHIFAVNLSNRLESSLRPRPEFKLQGREGSIKGNEQATETNKEIWRLFAWAVLAFLLFEWWIYNRRVYV